MNKFAKTCFNCPTILFYSLQLFFWDSEGWTKHLNLFWTSLQKLVSTAPPFYSILCNFSLEIQRPWWWLAEFYIMSDLSSVQVTSIKSPQLVLILKVLNSRRKEVTEKLNIFSRDQFCGRWYCILKLENCPQIRYIWNQNKNFRKEKTTNSSEADRETPAVKCFKYLLPQRW